MSSEMRLLEPMRDGDTLVIRIGEPIVGVVDLVRRAAGEWLVNNSLGSPAAVKQCGSKSADSPLPQVSTQCPPH